MVTNIRGFVRCFDRYLPVLGIKYDLEPRRVSGVTVATEKGYPLTFFPEEVILEMGTDLRDSLGTYLYDGDIVEIVHKTKNNEYARIKYIEGAWYAKWGDKRTLLAELLNSEPGVKVIGNAHRYNKKVSLCSHCNCMTHTMGIGTCGKCDGWKGDFDGR